MRKRWEIWHIAGLTRMKKMPSFADFVGPLKKKAEKGINEDAIKDGLKGYQDGRSRQSKR